jgi:biotin transport system permease protein
MGSLYSTHRTWLHGWSAGLKLAVLALWGTAQFFIDSVGLLALAATVCVLMFASLGQAAVGARKLLVSLVVACLLITGFHAYMGQVQIGLVSSLRLISASLLGVALTITTLPTALLSVFETVLAPLQRIGVRTDRIALQIGLMLRFTEHFFVVWKRLDDAHRVRTGKAGGLRLLAPLTIQMLLSARRVADALEVRLDT